MIWRKSFLSNFKYFFVRRKCFRVFSHVSIHLTDVVVGSSQIRMIWKKSFLIDFKSFFVILNSLLIITLSLFHVSKIAIIKRFLTLVRCLFEQYIVQFFSLIKITRFY